MRILEVLHWQPRFPYNNAAFYARRGDRVDTSLLFAGEKTPDPRGYDAVVVYGGYMSAYDEVAHPWIKEELRFLEACLGAGTRVLGICLGSQLLARLLGARVYKSEKPEFGFTPITLTDEGSLDPLFKNLNAGKGFLGMEWHNDAWDLPKGCAHLAMSERWRNQAFRYGDRVYAIQFHLEFTREHMLHALFDKKGDLPRGEGIESPESFLADPKRFDSVRATMENMLGGLLAIV